MFTQCPKCETVYSLSPADLRAANGFVRCGSCDTTFSALSRLQESPPLGELMPDDAAVAAEPALPAGEDDQAAEPDLDDADIQDAPEPEEEADRTAEQDAEAAPAGQDQPGDADTQVLDETWSDAIADEKPAAPGAHDDGSAEDRHVDTGAPDGDEPDADAADDAPVGVQDDTLYVSASNAFGVRDLLLDDPLLFPSEALLQPAGDSDDQPDADGAQRDPERASDIPDPDEASAAEAIALHDEHAAGDEDDIDVPPAASGEDLPPADSEAPQSASDAEQDGEAQRDPEQDIDDAQDRAELLDYLAPGLTPAQKIAGSLAAVLLLALLAAQLVHHWRATLVLDSRIGPQLQAIYQRLDLDLAPAADYRDYEVARHAIVPDPGPPERLRFRATVFNRAPDRRLYPAIRVVFHDRFGEESYVRTFAPGEYLEDADASARWLESGAAAEVTLDFAGIDTDATTNYFVEACARLAGGEVSCAPQGFRP